MYAVYTAAFVANNLSLYHQWIEEFCIAFFLIQFLMVVGIKLLDKKRKWKKHLFPIGLSVLALGMLVTQFFHVAPWITHEHRLFTLNLLLFFPLLNSAASQIRFGKTNVVLTRSLQYVIFFALCLFLYAIVKQLFNYILPTNPYRQLLEVSSLILAILFLRAVYLGNEQKFRAYFTTSQQQKYSLLKSFIATIPQFTSTEKLLNAIEEQLTTQFEAERVDHWWHGEGKANKVNESLYQQLSLLGGVWARNKELSDIRFDGEWEAYSMNSPYSLVAPIKLSGVQYGLLFLGRKQKGVYNLSDLELLAQLIQQTQLTLNVLQLLGREKELLQKSYEANLTALRSQINPHFLFNTLNTISALIHDSPDLAEEAVEKLAFIFRYTLKFSNQNLVSLENELELVSTYLEIEKIRFGSRLEVQISVEPEVKDVQIPAFVIQTLVENCIKHGIAKIIGRGIVSIDAYEEEGFMVCEVYDNGPGIDPDRIYRGTGLNNITTRMERMYEADDLLLFENTGHGTMVRLKIPRIFRNV